MIEEKDIERLNEIFVTRKECQFNMNAIGDKLHNDMVRLAVIEQQLKVITWILYAVSGGIIAMLVDMLFVK